MTLQLPETLKEAILVCTELIFTFLALLFSTYFLLPELFGSSKEVHALPPPVQEAEKMTEDELKQHDGSDLKIPLVDSDPSDTSSSTITPSRSYNRYDVFLSFRGADTRNNFTGHLYNYLVQKGLHAFMDDEELRKGEEISSELVKAIQDSKMSIIIFSENYASSRWCLDELLEILRCKEHNQQLVWSVFYKVDPSDVRYQKGQYAKHFVTHECKFKDNMEKVKQWRSALTDAANKSGWHFPATGHEPIFVRDLAQAISAEVSKQRYINVAKYPVGIEPRVQDMLELLDVEGRYVTKMVGMWGIGGIGKTTFAKAIYNSIRHMFEGSCFLANVRATSLPLQGLVGLQNDLLHGILGGEKMTMTDADRGIEEIKGRLGKKRVLIVLDDVNELNQLDKLAGALDWFGRGSRIIVTTRDKQVLKAHQGYPFPIYKTNALHNDEARTLLISNAFKGNLHPDASLNFPIDTAIGHCHGLPLAINILGSLLCGKNINQWVAALDNFSKSPKQDIQMVLGRSYLMLEYPLREAFLDIACFLKGQKKEYVMQALDRSSLNPEYALDVLVDRALINISQYGEILMHDLLEEMGKGIVHNESPDDAGKRSRVWFYKDVSTVLTEDTGSNKVKGIRVELPRKYEICLTADCFKKMKNLQLFININADFRGEVSYLPNQMRFLDWPGYPAQSLPADFDPQQLVRLNMANSPVSRVIQGFKLMQNLESLKLERCGFLTEIPDLSGIPNLKELVLDECAKLVELHPSVGFLDRLTHLYVKGSDMKTFPRMVKMRSLESISLTNCRRLENFPEIERRMESLRYIYVSSSAIREVPSSIAQAINLETLIITDCTKLTTVPVNIYEMQRLFSLDISECPNMVLTPFSNEVQYGEASSSNMCCGEAISSDRYDDGDSYDQEGNLASPSMYNFGRRRCNISDIDFPETLACFPTFVRVDFRHSKIVRLPCGITKSVNLMTLSLYGCKMLQELPELPTSLVQLDVGDCISLERISKLSDILNGKETKMFWRLSLSNCRKLCDNLIRRAHQVCFPDLFSMFLCTQYDMFAVIFPPSHQIPQWFSYRSDYCEDEVFEIDIQVGAPGNIFTYGKGLALCVSGRYLKDLKYKIQINEILMHRVSTFPVIWDSSWNFAAWDYSSTRLVYIPFNSLVPALSGDTIPQPPFICRVTIYTPPSADSCGVHLVMPP